MESIFRSIFGDLIILAAVALLGLDLITGILAALACRTFEWARVSDFMTSHGTKLAVIVVLRLAVIFLPADTAPSVYAVAALAAAGTAYTVAMVASIGLNIQCIMAKPDSELSPPTPRHG